MTPRTQATEMTRRRRRVLVGAACLAIVGVTAARPAAPAAPVDTATVTARPALQSAPRSANPTGSRTLSGRLLTVGSTGSYPTIAAALAAALDGDTIAVSAGTYRETGLHITRTIVLIGIDRPVIDGGGGGNVIRVTADDVVIRGLDIRNAASSHVQDNAAVLFEGVTGCTAADNRLRDNFFGIYVARSAGCVITGNDIRASGVREAVSGNGIHLWSSETALVAGNTVSGHRDGLYLEHVQNTELRENVSEDNLRYGLHFMFSNDNRYVANRFSRNAAGVAVMYSRGVLVQDNTFEDNWGAAAYGLLLKEIADSRIERNVFARNTVALSSEGSQRVIVTGNRFRANGWAARVMANSLENRFEANDFIDNAFDVTTNSRRNPNTFSGNYWSAYTGYDLDGDGVGDVPHRPVRLFSLIVERTPVALVLLRSMFVDVLDAAERVLPVLTPEALIDDSPRMKEVAA